jgi:hypothetical protein
MTRAWTALTIPRGQFCSDLKIKGRLSILFDLPCGQRVLNFIGKRIQMIGQFGKRFSLGFVRGQIGDQPRFSCLSAKMLQAALIVLHSLYPSALAGSRGLGSSSRRFVGTGSRWIWGSGREGGLWERHSILIGTTQPDDQVNRGRHWHTTGFCGGTTVERPEPTVGGLWEDYPRISPETPVFVPFLLPLQRSHLMKKPLVSRGFSWSEREDLNLRPLVSQNVCCNLVTLAETNKVLCLQAFTAQPVGASFSRFRSI